MSKYEYRSPSRDGSGQHVEVHDEERWAVQSFCEELGYRLSEATVAVGDHYCVVEVRTGRVVIEYTT